MEVPVIPVTVTLIRCLHLAAKRHRPEQFVLNVHGRIFIATTQPSGNDTTWDDEGLDSHYNVLLHAVSPTLASVIYERHACLRPLLEILLRAEELWVEVPFCCKLVIPKEYGVILVHPNGNRVPMHCDTFSGGERVYNHIAVYGVMMPDEDPIFDLTKRKSPHVVHRPFPHCEKNSALNMNTPLSSI